MKKDKTTWLIVLILSVVVFTVAGVSLIIHILPEKVVDVPTVSTPEVSSEPKVELADNPIDFASLRAQNTDVCGWITIPGTAADYPILQSGDDTEENFYLDHDIDMNYKFAGSIYIQKINYKDFSDPNTIIYGHDMLNGSMFGTLKRFRNPQFFEENQYIYIYTPGHILTYRIFSAFVYDNRHILNSFNFYKDEDYASFIEQSVNPVSMVKNVREDQPVTTSDRIITLSTCTGNDSERYLVEGVLISDQLTK